MRLSAFTTALCPPWLEEAPGAGVAVLVRAGAGVAVLVRAGAGLAGKELDLDREEREEVDWDLPILLGSGALWPNIFVVSGDDRDTDLASTDNGLWKGFCSDFGFSLSFELELDFSVSDFEEELVFDSGLDEDAVFDSKDFCEKLPDFEDSVLFWLVEDLPSLLPEPVLGTSCLPDRLAARLARPLSGLAAPEPPVSLDDDVLWKYAIWEVRE